MANYNKQFNFRNGVQVDDDNLVVTPTGLVGIGTTIPTEILDVDGNTVISGFATASQLRGQTLVVSGKATIGEIELGTSSNIVGSGVSIGAGIITASEPTGIVTFFGDARYLQGMPTSQWIDTDVGLGYTSIFSAGNVGVGTTDPRHSLQIGGNSDVNNFVNGVGIDSTTGNIQTPTGVVTAFKFDGDGSALTSINADQITSGTISNDRIPLLLTSKIPDNIDSSGIITATSFSGTDLTVTSIDVTDISATGIVTALSFVGDITGNVTGNVTGIASTALSLAGTPDIVVGLLTASVVSVSTVSASTVSASTLTGDVTGNLTGTATTATALTSDAKVDIDDISAGIATFTTTKINFSLGIGTVPSNGNITVGVTTSGIGADILIDRFAGINTTDSPAASLRLLSDKEESVITIGSSTAILDSNAQIRYGNRNTNITYSTEDSLDFINYGDGNINYYLQSGAPGIGTGDFHWHNNNSVMMSLTYGGNLGLGITNPSQRLNVQGISTFSDDAFFSSDVSISGNLTISSLSVSSVNANLFGNVTGDVVSSGISTFNDVSIGNTAFVESQAIVGTGITVPSHIPFAVNPGEGQFFVDDTSSVGIGTNIIGDEFVLDVYGGISGTQVSVGTTIPQSSVDFANAGIGTNTGFMIPPKVSDAERVGLATVTGAFIYNTTSNKLQVYTGSSWETITSA